MDGILGFSVFCINHFFCSVPDHCRPFPHMTLQSVICIEAWGISWPYQITRFFQEQCSWVLWLHLTSCAKDLSYCLNEGSTYTRDSNLPFRMVPAQDLQFLLYTSSLTFDHNLFLSFFPPLLPGSKNKESITWTIPRWAASLSDPTITSISPPVMVDGFVFLRFQLN